MNDDFRADLHCHSTCSDGTLSPEELVQLAKQIGLSGLAITDHDSTSAYPSVFSFAQDYGLEMISGAEFSTMHKQTSVHVLGYSFFLNHPAILTLCEKHQKRREERNRAILKELTAHGMPISEEEVRAIAEAAPPGWRHTIGRPHIAQAMVKKGYVASLQDAFRQYIGDGQPCFVRGTVFSVEETIATIHAANGFAVIAHPHLLKDPAIVPELLKMKFDGIECYYGNLPAQQHQRWITLAEKNGLFMTGGSDFHGAIKPASELGSSWIGEKTFRRLQRRFQDNAP